MQSAKNFRDMAQDGTLPEILAGFSSYKLVIQGCSKKTVEEYLLDLSTFARFIKAKRTGISPDSGEFLQIDISNADAEFFKSIKTSEIYDFLLYAGTVRNNMWSAKARKLSAIKALYKYMTAKMHMDFENPAVNIEAPKPKKTLPKFLTLEESITLLRVIQNDNESKTKLRDFAIVTLFLNCGMRLSELAGINLNDIDRELRSLRVVGKGSKERIIYLNSACRDALTNYLEWRLSPEIREKNQHALFLSGRMQRISTKTIQWMVYKYLDAAGLGAKHFSVHKLRHTAATLMYSSGEVDVRVLKDILGHEQLNTTQIYTHVSNAAMSEAMEKNPLAALDYSKMSKKDS